MHVRFVPSIILLNKAASVEQYYRFTHADASAGNEGILEDARQEAEIGGLDLDDFQQDWEADGTKITFVALAAVDPTGILKRADTISYGTIRIAAPDTIFSLKALALTDRTRSRDLFDVWFFLARLGYSMEQFAAEVVRMKRNYPFESVKSRLVNPVIPKFDPGFQPLINGPCTVDELVSELRRIVDAYEVREAMRFAERRIVEGSDINGIKD